MTGHEGHVPTREEVVAGLDRPTPAGLKTISIALAVFGLVVFIIGLFVQPDRAWQSLLVNWLYFTSISSAGVMFVAVQRITTARWSRPIIRFLEGYVAFLPVAFVLLLLILFVGRHHIFWWSNAVPTIHEKAVWLNPPFFLTRVVLVYLIITSLSVWYIYTSVRLDVGILPEGGSKWARGLRDRMRRGFGDERRELHSTHSLQGRLAVFLAFAFAFGWILLAWDLSMSIDPHFQSTMYGWWFFMGGWVAALASWTIIVMAWRRYLNRYDLIQDKHFHDLGKLCFAFTAFWGYLTFGQYLVIWYGNMGEETHWMRLRLIEGWRIPTLIGVTLMFVLPFFGLLSRAAKVFLPTMVLFAMSTVIGLWIHRYIEIYPSIYGVVSNIPLGLWELGVAAGLLGVWGYCYLSFMDAFPRMRVLLMTSPYRDEVQVPVDPRTMEPLPAHE
ncbi:MAG TPA: hypothetical protein VHT23_09000 [Gemmatimonadaceae bacterium]|jgi:hypothetical protein|nr:hypothetical protein [Gemmatimonadaceae bacterium]